LLRGIYIKIIISELENLLIGGRRELDIEDLRDLYSSPSIIRIVKSIRTKWERHVARMGEESSEYRLFVEKPDGKRPLGRP
jgi:hypothetical protein